jgi:hypothetical protein
MKEGEAVVAGVRGGGHRRDVEELVSMRRCSPEGGR